MVVQGFLPYFNSYEGAFIIYLFSEVMTICSLSPSIIADIIGRRPKPSPSDSTTKRSVVRSRGSTVSKAEAPLVES
jgi:hypothetical protein